MLDESVTITNNQSVHEVSSNPTTGTSPSCVHDDVSPSFNTSSSLFASKFSLSI